jgi:hypothetical protein
MNIRDAFTMTDTTMSTMMGAFMFPRMDTIMDCAMDGMTDTVKIRTITIANMMDTQTGHHGHDQ